MNQKPHKLVIPTVTRPAKISWENTIWERVTLDNNLSKVANIKTRVFWLRYNNIKSFKPSNINSYKGFKLLKMLLTMVGAISHLITIYPFMSRKELESLGRNLITEIQNPTS